MVTKLEWINLKDRLCPKCYSKLQAKGMLEVTFMCSKPECDFKISDAKYNEILTKLIKGPSRGKKHQEAFEEIENLEGLNNLGVEGDKLLDWGVEPKE
jgi:tRNA(Ile2) C34 agmatinyltransferase TiaS